MTATNTTPSPPLSQDTIATRLAQDRPTIDAAVKSFLSLYTARHLTSNGSDDKRDAITQARSLLKTINQFTFPLLPNPPSEEYKVVSQIWNGLIASQQKPSQFLGRIALVHAWNHDLPSEIPNYGESDFCQEFGTLLLSYPPPDDDEKLSRDCNACLVWDADQGAAELARRRARRAERAQQAQEASKEESNTLTIEELPSDNQETTTGESTVTIEEVNEHDETSNTTNANA